MCNCNNNNNSNCGCNPTPCVTVNCACPVFINSDCMNNVKAEFPCLGIESGLTATETFEAIDQAVCDKIAEVTNYISLVNVGEGAQVYRGVNGIGQKEIRSIIGSSLITVNQDTEEIQVSVDETELTTFIENLIPENSGLESVVAGDGIEVDNTDPLNPIVSADLTEAVIIPISDMVTNLTVGTSKAYFRMPFDMTLTQVIASVYIIQTDGSPLIFDINKGSTIGTLSSILSTKITIHNDSYTSLSAIQPVISNPNLLFNDMITFDIYQVGTPEAKGAVITLIGTRIP